MKRWRKWAGIGVAALAALAAAAVLAIYVASETQITRHYPLVASGLHAAKGPAAITRGKHFAGAYGCANCHGRNLQGVYIPDFGTHRAI